MKLLPTLFSLLPMGLRRVIWRWAATRNQWRFQWLRRLADGCARLFKKQDGTILAGAGQGLRFYCGASRFSYLLGTSEPGIQKALQTFLPAGGTFFDLGANVGFHTVIAGRLVGSSGHVVSFEPLEENASVVEQNARSNGMSQVMVRREAVGSANGTAEFLLSHEPTWGRLQSLGSVVAQPRGTAVVQVCTLDSLMNDLPAPNLMKVDIEGAEVEMLRGGREALKRWRPVIVMELHGTNHNVDQELTQLGYSAFVFNSALTVTQIHGEAYIIAAPSENQKLVDLARQFRSVDPGF